MVPFGSSCILCDCIIDNIWLCKTCFNKVGSKNFGDAIFLLPEYLDDSQHSKWLKLKCLGYLNENRKRKI